MVYAMIGRASCRERVVMVTVGARFQLTAVNVRLAGAATPSAALLEPTGITTSAIGWLASATWNVAVPPASVVARPATGDTMIAAASLSALLAATSAASISL